MGTSGKTLFTEKRVSIILTIFKYFYLITAIFLALSVASYVIESRFSRAFELLPYAIITSFIAYGIYKLRSWVSLVIILFASFGIITNILSIQDSPFRNLITIWILLFEIYFFNRRDVKARLHTRASKSTFR